MTEGEAREVCVMIMGGNRVDLPSGGTVDVLVSTTPTGKKSSQHSSFSKSVNIVVL